MKNRPAKIAVICYCLAIVFYGAMVVVALFSQIPILVPLFIAQVGSLVTGIVWGFKALKREKNTRNRLVVIAGFVMAAALLLFFVLSGLTLNRFDPKAWNATDSRGYPVLRDGMVDDLMENHLRVGMTHSEVIELLGDSVAVMYQRNRPQSDTLFSKIMIWDYDPAVMDGEFYMSYDVKTPRVEGDVTAPGGAMIDRRGARMLVIEFRENKTVGGFHLQEW